LGYKSIEILLACVCELSETARNDGSFLFCVIANGSAGMCASVKQSPHRGSNACYSMLHLRPRDCFAGRKQFDADRQYFNTSEQCWIKA